MNESSGWVEWVDDQDSNRVRLEKAGRERRESRLSEDDLA